MLKIIFYLIPVASLVYFVFSFGVNVPIYDEWELYQFSMKMHRIKLHGRELQG